MNGQIPSYDFDQLKGEWTCHYMEDEKKIVSANMYLQGMKFINLIFVDDTTTLFKLPTRKGIRIGHNKSKVISNDQIIFTEMGYATEDNATIKIISLTTDSLMVEYSSSYFESPLDFHYSRVIGSDIKLPKVDTTIIAHDFTRYWYIRDQYRDDWVLNIKQEGNQINGIITSLRLKKKFPFAGTVSGDLAYVRVTFPSMDINRNNYLVELKRKDDSIKWKIVEENFEIKYWDQHNPYKLDSGATFYSTKKGKNWKR